MSTDTRYREFQFEGQASPLREWLSLHGRRAGRTLWSVFRVLLLFGLSFIVLYPVLYMVSVAFRPNSQLFDPVVVWIPKSLTMENITEVVTAMTYGETLLTTLKLNMVSSLLQVISCAITGYGFARFQFRGKGILLFFVVFTIIVPPQTILLSSYLNYRFFDFFHLGRILSIIPGVSGRVNLVGTVWTFYLPAIFGYGIRSGLFILIFMQYFRGMPVEIEEAAYIDGYGLFQTFLRIMVPNAGPAILTVFLFSIVWYWNDFYLSGMYYGKMTVSGALGTLPQLFISVLDWTHGAPDPYKVVSLMQAGCLLTILPPLVLFILLQKYFTESVERTGIVG
jgi:multiple sugar transport system permease protein